MSRPLPIVKCGNAGIWLLPAFANRYGLITGATGNVQPGAGLVCGTSVCYAYYRLGEAISFWQMIGAAPVVAGAVLVGKKTVN
jgi:drug/metabolite transporter (DMT)-like permease